MNTEVRSKVNICWSMNQPARLLSYEAILQDLGQNLVTARSGLEALERLMQQEFAVVLLDVSMPGMTDSDGVDDPRSSALRTHAHHLRDGRAHHRPRPHEGLQARCGRLRTHTVVPEILRSKVAVLVELYLQRRELQQLTAPWHRRTRSWPRRTSICRPRKPANSEHLNASLRKAVSGLEEANYALHGEIRERARSSSSSRKPTGSRMNFLPCSRTSCAIRWPRSTTPCESCGLRPMAIRSSSGARCDRSTGSAPDAPRGRSAGCVAHNARQNQHRCPALRSQRRDRARGGDRANPCWYCRGTNCRSICRRPRC